jgi:predicted RNA-binding protein with TRAM domain
MQEGQKYRARIEGKGANGDWRVWVNGVVVFVKGAQEKHFETGAMVDIKITEIKKRSAFAVLV